MLNGSAFGERGRTMNDTGCRPDPNSPTQWGRMFGLAGMLGLCVSFFMPHLVYHIVYVTGGGRSEAFSPAELLGRSSTHLVGICLPFIAGILLLPMLAFRAMPRLDTAKVAGKFQAWATCAICLFVLIVGLGSLTCGIVFFPFGYSSMYIPPLWYALPLVGIGALSLAIAALVRSSLPRKAAAAQFALWAYCLTYFTYTASQQESMRVGLWLSIAASGALVIGSAIDWFQCRRVPK